MSVFGRWFAPSGPSEAPPAAPSGPSSTTTEREASVSAPSNKTAAEAPAPSNPHHHPHGGVEPVQVAHGYDSPEPDLYRTFSPSEVAFWDLKAPADGQSGSGFFARFFGSSGGSGGSGGAAAAAAGAGAAK